MSECSICMDGFSDVDLKKGAVRKLKTCGHIFYELCLARRRSAVSAWRSCAACGTARDLQNIVPAENDEVRPHKCFVRT